MREAEGELVSTQVARHLDRVAHVLADVEAERDRLRRRIVYLETLVRALGGDATPEG